MRLAISFVLILACRGQADGPSPEYRAAIEAYERAMTDATGDYTNPAFDRVLDLLARVPETALEHNTAQELISNIEQDRKDSAARAAKIESDLQSLTHAPADFAKNHAPAAPPDPLRSLPLPDSDRESTRSGFDQAAEDAKRKRLENGGWSNETKHNIQRRMDESLEERYRDANWECDGAGNCRKSATVDENEVTRGWSKDKPVDRTQLEKDAKRALENAPVKCDEEGNCTREVQVKNY